VEPVRTGLRNIMSELLRARPAEEAVVMAWPLVCGKDVAAKTHAASFCDGVLIVDVPDTIWRAQLTAFTPRYVSGFNELLGPLVSEVKFKVSRST
jgi:predicted nucleic acid-binding Zn ribbon protein